jgi:hypothetical protein
MAELIKAYAEELAAIQFIEAGVALPKQIS